MTIFSFFGGPSERQTSFPFSSLIISLTFFCLILMIASGCKKDSAAPPTVPLVTTAALTNITTSGATSGGSIVSDGGAKVTQSGIVWSKANTTPTLTDSVIAGTASSGTFTTTITGLDFNTTYYIRAYATNSVGTAYGNVVSLNTTNDTTKVRFTYNEKEVVYSIIISPTTGKKWLDRNLGAKLAATAFNDYQAYGDLFQWGRPADGHQLINWTASTTGTAVNGTTTVVATSDVPSHNNFIIAPDDGSSFYDWRNNNNNNRWSTQIQGPCPAGWHVPTKSEWAAEVSKTQTGGTATSGGITDYNAAYNQLKLTSGGIRRGDGSTGGQFASTGTVGNYWSSSSNIGAFYNSSVISQFTSTYVQVVNTDRAIAASIRCIKD